MFVKALQDNCAGDVCPAIRCAPLRRAGVRWMISLVVLVSGSFVACAGDWPQWRGPNRDGVWDEPGILQAFPPEGLKVLWRAPVGIGFSSPIVVGDRVFVSDSELAKPKAWERIHAFDAATGHAVWTYGYDVTYPEGAFDERSLRGPIATPIAADGKVYSLGAAGNVVCLRATDGTLVWRQDIGALYPGSDLYPSPSPLIEGKLFIVLAGATPGASVIAFDKNTGKQVWHALDEGPTASSPLVITAAGLRQLIIWSDRAVISLAPGTGETLWRQELDVTQDASVSTPVYHDGLLLVGGLMLQLDRDKPGAKVLWPDPAGNARRVFSDTSTAVFRDDYIYTFTFAGVFACIDAKTGKQVWETDGVSTTKNGGSVHPTINCDSVLLYTDHGDLIRARLAPDGYHEISRARVLEPATTFSGRKAAWAAPAFASGAIFARTNAELVCASLAAR